jgi:hypothetical protein
MKYSSFTTSALDRGEWSVSRPGRTLPPGKGRPVPTEQETGWAPEQVWTQRIEEYMMCKYWKYLQRDIKLCEEMWKENTHTLHAIE